MKDLFKYLFSEEVYKRVINWEGCEPRDKSRIEVGYYKEMNAGWFEERMNKYKIIVLYSFIGLYVLLAYSTPIDGSTDYYTIFSFYHAGK